MISNKGNNERPFVTLSAASSLDGFIATLKNDSNLSNSIDWRRVHNLRAKSDAIMVGSGTIRIDNSKLVIDERYVSKKPIKHPTRIVVSSTGLIPLNARVITHLPIIPTIIATTSKCSAKQRSKLEKKGCKVIISGDGPLTDLKNLLSILKEEFSVHKLMLEGGSRLNGEMLKAQLIDELHLSIAPVICGIGIPLFTLPKSFSTFSKSPFFEIISNEKIGDMIFLRMEINYHQRQIT